MDDWGDRPRNDTFITLFVAIGLYVLLFVFAFDVLSGVGFILPFIETWMTSLLCPRVYVAGNIVALLLYVWDKFCAVSGMWRVSEFNLLVAGILGPFGALTAMMLARHKIRQPGFWIVNIVALIFYVAGGLSLFCSPSNPSGGDSPANGTVPSNLTTV